MRTAILLAGQEFFGRLINLFWQAIKWVAAAVLLTSTLLAYGGSSVASAKQLGRLDLVRVGLDSYGGAAVVYAAQQQSYFAKYNIQVGIQTFPVGLDTLNAALAGSEDIGMAFDFGSLGAMATDRLRYVAVFTRTPGFDQLVVRANMEFPTDLRGKKMGVLLGTQQHYITVKYLQKIGVPLNTVQLVGFGSPLEMVAALQTGQIDGAWLFGKDIPIVKSTPGLRIIASVAEVLKEGLGLLIATKSFVQEKPAVLERFLAALVDAERWVNTDPQNLKAVAEYTAIQIKAPTDRLLAQLSVAHQTCSFSETDLAFLKGLAAFKASLPTTGASTAPPLNITNFEQYLALDALRKVNPTEVTVK